MKTNICFINTNNRLIQTVCLINNGYFAVHTKILALWYSTKCHILLCIRCILAQDIPLMPSYTKELVNIFRASNYRQNPHNPMGGQDIAVGQLMTVYHSNWRELPAVIDKGLEDTTFLNLCKTAKLESIIFQKRKLQVTLNT